LVPQRRDTPLVAEKSGDVLVLNGENSMLGTVGLMHLGHIPCLIGLYPAPR
jgi:hypothetical protein